MEYNISSTQRTTHYPDYLRRATFILLVVHLLTLVGCSLSGCGSGQSQNTSSDGSSSPSSPIAESPDPFIEGAITEWQTNMVKFGEPLCAELEDMSPSSEQALAATYYDGIDVLLRIAEYRNEEAWLSCANRAISIYRDNYVFPNGGSIPGYWNFTHGLTRHYLLTKDQKSQQAVLLIAKNAAFSRENTPLSETVDNSLSREVAYTIMTYLNVLKVGGDLSPRLEPLVGQALGHLEQWISSAPGGNTTMKPFMVALTSQALIQYYQYRADQRIPALLEKALAEMWNRAWQPDEGAFRYQEKSTNLSDEDSAPDLNLLIAPAYMWVGQHNNNVEFRTKAEQIFAFGVQKSFLGSGKHFNQNYRWSFDFVAWRNE